MVSNSRVHDVIVVGGGAMGLAAAYHACKQDVRVLVLEQFDLLHQHSGPSDATHQFRLQAAEPYMARMAQQAIPWWDELQTHTHETLRTRTGSLWFGDANTPTSEGHLQEAMQVMRRLRLPFEPLNAQQLDERFHFRNLPEHPIGFFQPDGGELNVPATLRVMFDQLQTSGRAQILTRQQVTEIRSADGEVSVTTSSGTFRGKKVVLAAGPYTNTVLERLGARLDLSLWQMASCYFKKRHPHTSAPSWFAFGRQRPEDPGLYYGFEEVDWSHAGYVRVAPAFAHHVIEDPANRMEGPAPRDLALTEAWVARHRPDLEPKALFPGWCLATLPMDGAKKMFLDFAPTSIPGHRNIVVFAGGWTFRFVPLLGRICADLALYGRTEFDISPFQLSPSPPAFTARAVQRSSRLPF
ncbi:FAD-dependent oxidoreductase [Myxococcaceae bacterium GXIMD 01537]